MLKTLCLLLCLAAPLPATTIIFGSLPSQLTASLNISGVTVTGSPGPVSVSGFGLGVVGGFSNLQLDAFEFLDFTFNGASANNVSLGLGSLTVPVTFYRVGVTLLGGGTVSGVDTNLSSIAGFQPITRFVVANVNLNPNVVGPFSVTSLTFDITAPEPSSLAMVITALAVLALGRRRQRIAPGN